MPTAGPRHSNAFEPVQQRYYMHDMTDATPDFEADLLLQRAAAMIREAIEQPSVLKRLELIEIGLVLNHRAFQMRRVAASQAADLCGA